MRTALPPPFPPRFLDTACILKEEPNSAQRRVPPYRNRTWSLSHLLAAAWGNEQMYRHQKCAHFLQSHPARNIPNRTDCVSRFESKSFLENILESYAGGEGYPQENVPVSGSMCAHFPWPIRHTDIPNRTDSVPRFESKSFLENILESNAGGAGVPPPRGWRQSAAQCQESDRLTLLFSCSLSRHRPVR
jgi:hypothetical protein